MLRTAPFVCCLLLGISGGLVLSGCTDPNGTVTSCNGVADQTPCGTTPKGACDAQDVCQQGVCVAKSKADGTTCGSAPKGDCESQGQCKAGTCVTATKPDGAACGGLPASACAAQNLCAKGVCVPQVVADGTACGDAADGCHSTSICAAGTCTAQLKTAGTVCKKAADGTCDRDDVCDAAGNCVDTVAPVGTGCVSCPAGAGQCGACAAGACPDTCPSGSGTSLAMPVTLKNGNEHDGIMFNIVATKAFVLTGLDTVLLGTKGPVEIRIHHGDYKTVEGSAAAWTLVATITPDALNAPPAATALPLSTPVVVPAGEKLGVYITGKGGSGGTLVALGTDVSDGNIAGDDAITVTTGKSISYPFNTTLPLRQWNGRVTYQVSDSLTLGADKNTAVGAMFDLVPLSSVRLQSIKVGLAPVAAAGYSITLHERFGSYAEATTDASRWRQLVSVSGITPDGDGYYTLKIEPSVVLPAGVRTGFAVTTSGGTGIDITKAAQAGTKKTTSGVVELYTGVTLTAPFTPGAQAATPTGAANFSVCP